MENRQAEHYLTTLAEMEQNWQSAVDKALSVREDQLTTAKQVIASLKTQVQQLEATLKARDEEVADLKRSLLDTQVSLDSTREDMTTLLDTSQKQLEDQSLEHERRLEAKDREMDDLRTRQQLALQELSRGARQTLQELETQLEVAKESEAEVQRQLAEAREIAEGQSKKLHDWDRVSEKMCRELDDAKGKLKSSKFANGKLREEMALWKKYAEKVEEERKTLRREVELERKVLQKLSQVDGFLKTERQHRDIILETMNRFGTNLMRNIKALQESKQTRAVSRTTTTQTERPDEWEEKNEIIHILEERGVLLEEELKKKENDLEHISAQNATLREVVLKMKKEREDWEREREQMDEEARVSKLEESVRLIKNNFINDQKDVCVWSALQGVKKEVSDLKNRKVHNAAMAASINTRPFVIAKPVVKNPAATGVPLMRDFRSRVPLKY